MPFILLKLLPGAAAGGPRPPGEHSPGTAGTQGWSRCSGCPQSALHGGWICARTTATPSPPATGTRQRFGNTGPTAAAPKTPPKGQESPEAWVAVNLGQLKQKMFLKLISDSNLRGDIPAILQADHDGRARIQQLHHQNGHLQHPVELHTDMHTLS